jgi:transcriptional regulator with XRE-family HTH domain
MYPNLKLQLWKSGIRQNRLARLLGVDETVLSRIVNGFREPNPQLQSNIATLLKCDAKWLFDENDVPRADAESPVGVLSDMPVGSSVSTHAAAATHRVPGELK